MADINLGINHIVGPHDAMLSEKEPDTAEKQTARSAHAQEVKRVLIDPKKNRFTSKGTVTIEWTMDDGQTWEEQDIPIRSIPADRVDQINEGHEVDKSDVPRIWNPQTKSYELELESIEGVDYQMRFLAALHDIQWEKLVWGFDGDLASLESDQLVWSSANPNDYDVDLAVETWKAMGLDNHQLAKVTNHIDLLTNKNRKMELDDFEGKPQPQSASQEKSTTDGKGRPRRASQRRSIR